MEQELKNRIKFLNEKLKEKYLPSYAREEIEDHLSFLESMYQALYLY